MRRALYEGTFLSWLVLAAVMISPGASAERRSCAGPSGGLPALHAGEDYIYDSCGRVALLRGANFPTHHKKPVHFTTEDLEVLKSFGFNFIRMGVSWAQAEPVEGEIDQAYIDSIVLLAREAGRRGIYVMPEVHQIGWCSPGSYIPQWVCEKHPRHGADFARIAVETNRFWSSEELQGKLIRFWVYLAGQFKDLDNLLGYNIMNEPIDPAFLIPGRFENKLFPFYEKVITAIRKVHPGVTIIVEPCVASIFFPTKARPLAHSDIVYSVHPYFFHAYTGKGKLVVVEKESPAGLARKIKRYVEEAEAMGAPLQIGEFGGPHEGYDFAGPWLDKSFELMDEYFLGYAIWVYETGGGHWAIVDPDRRPRPLYWPYLHRPYPRYTCGRPVRLHYVEEEKKFAYTYRASECSGAPTEIYVPKEFMDEFEVSVSGAKWKYDVKDEIMSVWNEAGADEVSISIE